MHLSRGGLTFSGLLFFKKTRVEIAQGDVITKKSGMWIGAAIAAFGYVMSVLGFTSMIFQLVKAKRQIHYTVH